MSAEVPTESPATTESSGTPSSPDEPVAVSDVASEPATARTDPPEPAAVPSTTASATPATSTTAPSTPPAEPAEPSPAELSPLSTTEPSATRVTAVQPTGSDRSWPAAPESDLSRSDLSGSVAARTDGPRTPVTGDIAPAAQPRPRLGRAVTTVTFQAPEPAAIELVQRRRRESSPTSADTFSFGSAFGADRVNGDAANGSDGASTATAGPSTGTGGDRRYAQPEPRPAVGTGSGVDDDPEHEPELELAGYTDADAPTETDPAADDSGDSASTRRRRRGRRGRGRARADEETDNIDELDTAAFSGARGRSDESGLDSTADSGRSGADDPRSAADREPAESDESEQSRSGQTGPAGAALEEEEGLPGSSRRRRRRRRRDGAALVDDGAPDDPPVTVVHVREGRTRDDEVRGANEVRGVSGSTRLEAKRQRRREGRDSGRRRPPIVTEAEFLARREAVERRMIVRNAGDRTQIAVLEDGVLVEHFVTRASSWSYAGNVYLGRVQNVLASMEAAFVDIGKGRNAVLYAGEVNYDASGLDGRPRKIEQVLKSGQSIVVQVSKDPIGHKGARLTSQVSLPGRYLVYVPDGQNAGISRKLPDTERARLKAILKKITPEDGGVIVRTAAEGASEQELARDVARLSAQWEDICRKATKATAPALLYGEPDLVIRVIRDIFNEDFAELVVQGAGEATMIEDYVDMVAPDLRDRVRRQAGPVDVFDEYRVDEQLAKALERKVWLPSGGSLVIDRTEAMTVIDVNTGKFTGKGGNLEETVTKNNLEAAEEIVRQLRLRDIGGIIVIDFIDMVLESNRELVLRRLTECLGRDRTRHQVAEVTSLGLVQMTRKRVGQGLLEAYSEPCTHCGGRGVILHLDGASAPARGVPADPPVSAPAPTGSTTSDAVAAGAATGTAAADPVVADAVATAGAASGAATPDAQAPGAAPADAVPAAPDTAAPGGAAPGTRAARGRAARDRAVRDDAARDDAARDDAVRDTAGHDGAANGSGPSSNGSRSSGARAGRRRASRAVAPPQESTSGDLETVGGAARES
ncbi:Rne/Rng family ribonuclease [Candidatus Protofrankia datiscae]|uniref:Rne/Rng family ribonuclease n=1 Tax=Candidatus Protofrankia datiscae TaxID=2716812 RepID=UPI003D67016B